MAHTSTGDLRPMEAVEEMCALLRSGKNVVSSSVISLLHPPSADRMMVEKLEAACAEGATSCFTSGIDPGFANDVLPLTLTGFSSRVDSVRVSEILNYATYNQPTVLFETFGFGKPMDEIPFLLMPGVLSYAWGAVMHLLADGLGVELDEVRETYERRAAPETFAIDAGTIDAGTVAALRFGGEDGDHPVRPADGHRPRPHALRGIDALRPLSNHRSRRDRHRRRPRHRRRLRPRPGRVRR